MSNLETVQEMYAAFGRGDIPAILSRFADDIEIDVFANRTGQNGEIPWFKPRRGMADAGDFFNVVGQLKVSEFNVLSLMNGGDQVAAEFTFEADVPGGGHYRDEEVHLWKFNEQGKVIRLRQYLDSAKHVEAARNWPK